MIKSATKKQQAIPPTSSLVNIVALTGIEERQILRIVAAGFIPRSVTRGQYDLAKTIRGLIAYYKSKADGLSDSYKVDKAAEQKANSEIAQLKAAKEKGSVIFAKDAEAIWEDGFAKISVCIRTAKIPNAQKKALFDEIMAIKLEPLPEDES